jgi:hypothetical protein
MTVSSELNRKEYAGDGLTTAFATSPVVFFDSADLKVYVVVNSTGVATLKTITTHYTVTGGDGSTGTVTMLTAPASGETLVIVRNVAATQSSDFVNNDINDAEVLEDALDRLTMIAQQNAAAAERSVRMDDADISGIDTSSLTGVGNAGKYLRINAGGTALEFADGDLNESTFTQSGAGATERAVTAKLGEIISVKDFGALGNGTTDDKAAIALAVTAASGHTLFFPSGTYKISSALTISGCSVWFEKGAILKPDASVAVVVNAPLIAGMYQIFNVTNSGATAEGQMSVERYLPQWWGAKADHSTDDTAAIQAAINCVESLIVSSFIQGGTVFLPQGVYRTSAPLTVETDNLRIVGDGPGTPKGGVPPTNNAYGGTVIRPLAAFSGSEVLRIGQPSASVTRCLAGNFVEKLSIDGGLISAGTVDGIFFQTLNGGLSDLYVTRVSGDGIVVSGNGSNVFPDGAFDNQLHFVKVDDVGGNGMTFTDGASDTVMVGCIIEFCDGHGIEFESIDTANMLTGCYIYDCTGKAVFSAAVHHQKFVNCRFQDCNGGIYMSAVGSDGGVLISGCTFRNMSNAADNTTDAINITSTAAIRGGTIVGCDFHTGLGNSNTNYNRMRYGINLAHANITSFTIGPMGQGYSGTAASCFGTAPINDAGSNTVIAGGLDTNLRAFTKYGNGVMDLSGADTPEAAVTAPVGSTFRRSNGGANTSFYVKESGTGNTGWVAK